MESGSEFSQQFVGSAAANFAFGILFLVYLGIKKWCERDKRCKSNCHTSWCDCSVRDVTMRESPISDLSNCEPEHKC